jgi:hypothetical protein
MACCSSLGEAVANATEVENMDKAVIVTEVERVLGKTLAPLMMKSALRARMLRTL